MKITINRNAVETAATTVAELLAEQSVPLVGTAVAIGDKVIRREDYATTALTEGDNLLIIWAAYGG